MFLTENELKFVQIKHFLKGIASLRIKKVTKYGRISAIFQEIEKVKMSSFILIVLPTNQNMKLLVSLTAILFSVVSFSQDFKKKINIKALNAFVENEMNILNPIDSLETINIKAFNWDTDIYNPYKNEKITFPLEIKFEDTSYTSPIKIKKVIFYCRVQ